MSRLMLFFAVPLLIVGGQEKPTPPAGAQGPDPTRSAAQQGESPARRTTGLDGPWRFRRDDQKEWKAVPVPSTFQSHEGIAWHGVGWYERTIDPVKLPEGRRLLVHFTAAATHATVFWNDQKLGEHLGGWTPFRFDVTEHVLKHPGQPATLRVRLDEKVGHNTQGFLPIIQPHYGGLWQGVQLIEVPAVYVDDLRVKVVGIPRSAAKGGDALRRLDRAAIGVKEEVVYPPDFREKAWDIKDPPVADLEAEVPVLGAKEGDQVYVLVHYSERGKDPTLRKTGIARARIEKGSLAFKVPVYEYKAWSPSSPVHYDLKIQPYSPSADGRFRSDVVTTRFASFQHSGIRSLEFT